MGGTPGEVLLAVDVGTSGARAVVFDLDGHRLLEVRRSYPPLAIEDVQACVAYAAALAHEEIVPLTPATA